MEIFLYVLGAAFVGLFALIGFQHVTKGTPIREVTTCDGSVEPPSVSDEVFAETIGLHTGSVLREGHRVELLTCGDETYPRLWADLRAAKVSITLQLYYCKPGRMADEFHDIIVERARAGVKVLFLHDAFGSNTLKKEWLDSLRDAGVKVVKFREVKITELHKFQSRSHIRVVVIDGCIGYTGGFGIDDKWFGNGRRKDEWRDTNVRFTGPAVLQLQATFADGWCEPTGELLAGEKFFPVNDVARDGPAVCGIVHAAPTIGSTIGERLLALSIVGARKKLYITNAYFVPDDDFRRLMCERAKKGVDVRVLTTGKETDIKTTWHAGRARYEQLLEAGVRIWEYEPTMLHAKSIVADGVYTIAGTMNFDNRSLAFNDETMLITLNADLAARAEKMFLDDLEYSAEITLEEHRLRPLRHRVMERFVHLFSRIL